MPFPVPLKDVIAAIEPLADEWHAYISRDTGEIIGFSDEEAMMAEHEGAEVPAWFVEQAPKVREALSSEAFVELPGKFGFHEYSVMESFALALPGRVSERLLQAMRGRGAFRRFKQVIAQQNVEQQWFAYRDLALKELAIEFLQDEGIPFVDGQEAE
jgi:hypothetical protein